MTRSRCRSFVAPGFVCLALFALRMEWGALQRDQTVQRAVSVGSNRSAPLPLDDGPEVYEWDASKSIVGDWRRVFDELLASASERHELERLKRKDRERDAADVSGLVSLPDPALLPRELPFRVVQLNARGGEALDAKYLAALDADVVVLVELHQFGERQLHDIAQQWRHTTAWIGQSRNQLDVGVTCRRCALVQSRKIGLGHWGRDVVYPVPFRASAHALVLQFGERVLHLVVAQLDASSPSQRQLEATEIERFIAAHQLHLKPLLVVASDAGLARADFEHVRGVRDVRSLVSSSLGTAFEATDALAAYLRDLCVAPTVPTNVVAPTPYRVSAAAVASQVQAPLRVDYMFVSSTLEAAGAACQSHRTAATANLSDHFPLVAQFQF
jgi:endonuclease/exonuclease/phosphatase (EEP) superfamily protein YafD